MNKWEHRENKLEKKRRRPFPLSRDIPNNDKSKRREIKQARRDKESVWDNLESEGDE